MAQATYREDTADATGEPQAAFAYDALAAGTEESHNVAAAGDDATSDESTFLRIIGSGSTALARPAQP